MGKRVNFLCVALEVKAVGESHRGFCSIGIEHFPCCRTEHAALGRSEYPSPLGIEEGLDSLAVRDVVKDLPAMGDRVNASSLSTLKLYDP